jgi:uncharacterized protein YndB with AHSA1/START domain
MYQTEGDAASVQRPTKVERTEREIIVTRTFDAPARLVFDAWTKPELFKRWWAPRSLGMHLRSVELDVRTGGTYRLEFGEDPASSMAFFGKYIEVVPNSKIVWTNDEGGDEGSVTTVTFEEQDGQTLLTFRELYPSKEALEANAGAEGAMPDQLDQLEELLASMAAS